MQVTIQEALNATFQFRDPPTTPPCWIGVKKSKTKCTKSESHHKLQIGVATFCPD